jgi:CRISPR/Cas system-associated protein Cas7 (RAMP superfamily)
VWEENWDTLMVFLSLSTQWRREIPAMAGQMLWHGLDYTAVESVLRLMGHWAKRQEIFESLQIMEAAALPVLNKASK